MDKILKMVDELLANVETSEEAYELYDQISEIANKFYARYEVLMGLEEDE